MGRNRVLSFMSQFSNRESNREPLRDSKSPEPAAAPMSISKRQGTFKNEPPRRKYTLEKPTTPPGTSPQPTANDSPQSQYQGGRARAPSAPSGSRPVSMIQTYQPPLMELTQDTLPELQPIFTFLNSHANKLYQEGYFLKLDDQSVAGRANADRTWTECFAQLVGTVLSLWDAQELDAAGQDGEVLPKFINLTDASIKMIESLPTRSDNEAPLQNVLSISTAGKNRYLLHFNSHHSLIQWTAGIRLAMFEHATLQEAYTGALIAGKGKSLNNINTIMERTRIKHEDWARVRFGAGTPWRRCWCVISPPDEKEVQKLQKELKKKSAYDRSRPHILKGDIKFYDTRKTKKMRPIATINDAYSAFAIYPQSKPLIDASTLVKVEGNITIHSNPESTTEGFVFVMPEVHPAVSGFEMMLRWLFPVFDTFGLYGRPSRLVADTIDPRSLMFAMPKHRRYGYLEILDVSGLILEQGSSNWKEIEWRRKMKELTGRRMTAIENGSRSNSRYSSRRTTRASFGPSRSRVAFDDGASIRSSPSMTWNQTPSENAPFGGIPRTDSAPPGVAFDSVRQQPNHLRSVSETQGLDRYQNHTPVAYDEAYEKAEPPLPPPHTSGPPSAMEDLRYAKQMATTSERVSSEDEQPSRTTPVRELQDLQANNTPEPVATPPAFAHGPGSLPISKPYDSPELRRAKSRMSNATLSQLAGAGGVAAAIQASGSRPGTSEAMDRRSEESGQIGVQRSDANTRELPANKYGLNEGVVAGSQRFSFERPRSPIQSDNHNDLSPQQQFPFPSSNPATVPYSHSSPSIAPSNGPTYTSRTYDPNTVNAQLQQPPPVPTHSATPSLDSTRNHNSQPPRLETRQSIARKPLPHRSSLNQISDATSPETASSSGSLAQHFIDQTAFDLVVPRDEGRKTTPLPETQFHRQNSNISSVYDYEDTVSTASPDYASTRKSTDTRESVEKPRAGVMRTVGNTELSTEYDMDLSLPNIDFGPTINYAAERPQRQSPTPAGRASPNQIPGYAGRATGRNMMTPEQGHYRKDSAEPRTVAWQPGMSTVGGMNSGQQAITPEQFVQQRVNANPMYAHQRQHSSGPFLRSNTPTPPLFRKRSSEILGQQTHSRNSSGDLLQRPGSRGTSAVLGQVGGTGDYSSHLSAREQEHVARVTGQPLINMAINNKKAAPGGGLVGAIDAREKEKQQMKQGLTSQAVQNAIAKRQSLGYQQQSLEYPPAGHRTPSPYGRRSQYDQYSPQQFPTQSQRPQSWVSPAAAVYGQGGGWSRPYAAPPEHQQQSSQQQYISQAQYPQQQPGQGGRGNQGYHGHGL